MAGSTCCRLLQGAFRVLIHRTRNASALPIVWYSALHVDGASELGTSVDGIAAELLLDAQDLVELRETLGTGWCTGFLVMVSGFGFRRELIRLTIWPARRPTAISAMVTSSVSPER